jgi:hypothetical protein
MGVPPEQPRQGPKVGVKCNLTTPKKFWVSVSSLKFPAPT